MQMNESVAEKRIADLGMDDLPLIQIRPASQPVPSDWFKRYHDLVHEFALSLTDSIQELAFMNLSQDDFMDLIMARRMPENLSVRFRIPLVWGGKLELDNLFMCMTPFT